jgi:hypothetical protein
VAQYGSQTKAAAALHMSRKTIARALGRAQAGPAKSWKVEATGGHANERKGRSVAEFRSVYDKSYIVPRKVRAALKALAGGWEYEVAFAKLAGVSLVDLGNVRDEFADHIITLRESRRVWAGTVATAKQLRSML